MGLSHSIAFHHKTVHNSPTSTAHFSDEDSIEYPQLLPHGSDRRLKEKDVLPWWKSALSRLSPSRNRRISYINSKVKTTTYQRNTYDSDADTTLSLTPPPQHFTDDKYFRAQTESIRVGLENCDSYTLGLNEWGNSSSHVLEVNVPKQTESEDCILAKQSLSSARLCKQTKHKCILASDGINHPEPEAVSIAKAEIMYTKATWRMYERITSSRNDVAVTNEKFSIPNVILLSKNDVASSPTGQMNKWGDTTSCDEGLHDDEITELSSSVDRHHACFEMDQD